MAYRIGKNFLNQRTKEIKMKLSASDASATFSDSMSVDKLVANCNHKALHYFEKVCEMNNIELTKEQKAAICIPNSPTEFTCYGWMDYYFNVIGDQEPNRDGEIHLEPVHIKDIHKEYLADMTYCGEDATLSLRPFGELWANCFP